VQGAPPVSAARPPALAASRGCVTRALAAMSPTQRAAQVLLVGVDATRPAAAGTALARSGVGGVFLRGRVSGNSRLQAQLAAVQTAARRSGAQRLLVAVDQEGGAVQTVRGGTLAPFPAALVQGTWSSRRLRESTTAWGTELRRLGVNLDLAPVADVVPASLGVRNPPIGRYGRQYGSTPATVAPRVATVAAALRAGRVGPTVKHFPGLGRVLANTDTSTAAVDATTTATDPALGPFTAATRAGALAVMMSSARYPRLDRKQPAMWSPAIVTGLLRTRLGWKGLVVSDDLGNAGAARILPVGRRATAFVAAGGDLVLTVVPGQAVTMRAAIVARAATDPTFRARVDDAVRHVLAAKLALGLLRCG
jgi:beta-N-acetylhexosaminidase